MKEENTDKTECLRRAIEAGEKSGLSVPYDHDAFKARLKAKYIHKTLFVE